MKSKTFFLSFVYKVIPYFFLSLVLHFFLCLFIYFFSYLFIYLYIFFIFFICYFTVSSCFCYVLIIKTFAKAKQKEYKQGTDDYCIEFLLISTFVSSVFMFSFSRMPKLSDPFKRGQEKHVHVFTYCRR